MQPRAFLVQAAGPTIVSLIINSVLRFQENIFRDPMGLVTCSVNQV